MSGSDIVDMAVGVEINRRGWEKTASVSGVRVERPDAHHYVEAVPLWDKDGDHEWFLQLRSDFPDEDNPIPGPLTEPRTGLTFESAEDLQQAIEDLMDSSEEMIEIEVHRMTFEVEFHASDSDATVTEEVEIDCRDVPKGVTSEMHAVDRAAEKNPFIHTDRIVVLEPMD